MKVHQIGGGRKSTHVGKLWPVGLYCQPQSQSLSSGIWILDLGLGFGNGLGLDNFILFQNKK